MAHFEVSNVVATPSTVSAVPVTGTADDQSIRLPVVIGAFVVVGVASVAGWAVFEAVDPTYFVPRSDYTALAAVVLFATALERLLQPLSKYLLPDGAEQAAAQDAKKAAREKAADPDESVSSVKTAANLAAGAVATLSRKKSERSVIMWSVATALAFTGPALLGIFFLRVVSVEGSSPNRYLDMLLTALIVGAGTKPVHDAIASIEAKKETVQAAT
jgi:hypothetical protein